MRRHKATHLFVSQINVVPYIDVMLVLLIIFMATAPMFVPGVVNLPRVGSSTQVKVQPIEINLTLDGKYSVTQNHKVYPMTGLNEVLILVHNLSHDSSIVISADKDVKYENVMQIVNKLYANNIKKVALVVKNQN
jgi:biopolymer transport protein TolR